METDKKICKTLLHIMETKPYDKIKVSELISIAGISRSSFYFYYDSIEAALSEIERGFIEGMSDGYAASLRLLLREKRNDSFAIPLAPYLKYMQKNLDTFRILSSSNGNPIFQDKLKSRIRSMYDQFNSSPKKSYASVQLFIELLSGGQWYVFKYWANNPQTISIDDVSDFLSEYMESIKNFLR